MTFIKLTRVHLAYGSRTILRDLTLTLNAPSIVGLVGRSGSGKSTLLKLLAGLIEPTSGSIEGDTQRVSWVPQDTGLFPWLTISENIAFPLSLRRQFVAPPQRQRIANGLCRQLHLSEAVDRLPMETSGGEKQRAAIGRALASSSNLLLLDEPFASLDPMAREDLRETLRQVTERNNMITVFASHDLLDVAYLCDRVVIITTAAGQNVAEIALPGLGRDKVRQPGLAASLVKRIMKHLEAKSEV